MKNLKLNFELDKKTIISSVKSITLLVASLLLIAYLVYHAANGFQSKVEFEGVFYSSGEKTEILDAYVFRDETIVSSNFDGVVSYYVKENEKVTDRTVLAKVYAPNANLSLVYDIEKLNKQIYILSAVGTNSQIFSDISYIDTVISSDLCNVTGYIQTGDIDSAIASADALLIDLSRKQLRMNSQKNFSEYIASLTAQRDALSLALPSAQQTIISNSQGYFSKLCDGYEYYFDYNEIPNLSVSDFFTLKENAEKSSFNSNTIGKIISDFEWYLVCPIEHNMTVYYEEGNTYELTFMQNMNVKLPAYLERIVTESDEGEALLIFKCDRMPDNFNYMRNQKITVTLDTVSGLKVPRSSVRVIDGKTFVYILIGGRVNLRSVDIIDEAGEYYYINENSESVTLDGVTYYGLRQNDNVITYGTNLYHGKIYN